MPDKFYSKNFKILEKQPDGRKSVSRFRGFFAGSGIAFIIVVTAVS